MARAADRDDEDVIVLEADVDAVTATPGRPTGGRPGGAHSLAIAVAVLVLLTAGVAAGGIIESPTPSTSPARTRTPQPTNPVTGCRIVGVEQTPTFSLRASDGDALVSGLVGAVARPGFEANISDWLVPPTPMLGVLPSGSALEVTNGQDQCIRSVTAAFVDATLASPPRPVDWRGLIDGPVEPASAHPPIGELPDGEWVIRVEAKFETGIVDPDGLVTSTLFFRVRLGDQPTARPSVRPTPTPERTPAVTPAVTCGPSPGSALDIDVLIQAPGGPEISGAEPGASPPAIEVAPGDSVELRVAADACATSWDIMIVRDSGTLQQEISQRNLDEDQAFAAQNHWSIRVGSGTYRLIVELAFGRDITIHEEWGLVGRGFRVPKARLAAGDAAIAAVPGCGVYVTLSNGFSDGEDCGTFELPTGLETLVVPAWSLVTFEIPGWAIASWSGMCGRMVVDAGEPPYLDPSGCWSIGSFSASPHGPPVEPARFLARPGRQIVQITATAARDGDTYSVPYYAIVTGE